MPKHTPEPWIVDDMVIYANEKIGYIATADYVNQPETSFDERRANARRIATCVNACAGLNIDQAGDDGLRPIIEEAHAVVSALLHGDELDGIGERAATVMADLFHLFCEREDLPENE